MEICQILFSMRDEGYAAFQAKLVPTVAPDRIIGVRVPLLRRLARDGFGTPAFDAFLAHLPHGYYDENMLHALLIGCMRDYDAAMDAVDAFLPYVDNWAVCDSLLPRVPASRKADYLCRIRGWIASRDTYTCRFGIKALMTDFLDADFDRAYPEWPAGVHSDAYYIRMMVAWYFATALAKQWDAVLPYLQHRRLDDWTHRKTIQKAMESYRISPAQKAYLKTLR